MKAILVIDMPNGCDDCKFMGHSDVFSDEFYCMVGLKNGNRVLGDLSKRNKNCPLKEMPNKRETPTMYKDNYELNAEIKGWNDCIDEIVGNAK